MTNSELFTAAHKLAKTFEGNYTACFVLALKEIREMKEDSFFEKASILKLEASSNVEATLIELEGKILATRELREGYLIPTKEFNAESVLSSLSHKEDHPFYTELYLIEKEAFFDFYKKAGYFQDSKRISKYEGKNEKGHDFFSFPEVLNNIEKINFSNHETFYSKIDYDFISNRINS